jgi:hypothetical protein
MKVYHVCIDAIDEEQVYTDPKDAVRALCEGLSANELAFKLVEKLEAGQNFDFSDMDWGWITAYNVKEKK